MGTFAKDGLPELLMEDRTQFSSGLSLRFTTSIQVDIESITQFERLPQMPALFSLCEEYHGGMCQRFT